MKHPRILRAAAALLAAALCLSLAGGGLADSTPAIYRVADGEGHEIYLLGTCHIVPPEALPIAGIDELLDGCDTLAIETVTDEAATLQMAAAIIQRTGNDFPPETRARIEDFFTARGLGMLNPAIPALSPATLMLLVELLAATGEDPMNASQVEPWLEEQALARGMAVIGLESAEDHVRALTDGLMNISDEDALAAVNSMLDEAEAYTAEIAALQDAWMKGNALALTLMSAMPESEESEAYSATVKDVVLDERNEVFFDRIEDLLRSGGRVLVAVGLAHVFAPVDGLLMRLTNAGYEVTVWQPAGTAVTAAP